MTYFLNITVLWNSKDLHTKELEGLGKKFFASKRTNNVYDASVGPIWVEMIRCACLLRDRTVQVRNVVVAETN